MSFVFNDQAVQLARDLNRLYRSNSPVVTIEPEAGPVRAEDVINPKRKLGPLESPLVLAVMAAKDPFEGMSLAASVRMMPMAKGEMIVGAIFQIIGEVSKHEYVQETCYEAISRDFAPTIISDIRSRAVTRIDTVRQEALASLVDRVRHLSDSVVVEEEFIDEMFTLAFRCDLRTDTFRDMLVEEAKALVAGDPKDKDTFIGPMIDDGEAERVEAWTKEALDHGAKLLCGGTRDGRMIPATLLENVDRDAKVVNEEVFGPLAVLMKFSTFDEAIEETNRSEFGLQAGIFTRDLFKMFDAWDRLDYGGICINEIPSYRVDNMPYGGVKNSGLGREGVRFAMEDMTEIRNLVIRR